MNEQSQNTDEYQELAAKHHELDERLSQLTAKHYLSEPEQLDEATLKKRKLQIKARMEDLRRRRPPPFTRSMSGDRMPSCSVARHVCVDIDGQLPDRTADGAVTDRRHSRDRGSVVFEPLDPRDVRRGAE